MLPKINGVSIPLNRVGFVIIKRAKEHQAELSFNPLKSGRFCNLKPRRIDEARKVSIPLNRVGFVIESVKKVVETNEFQSP